METENLEVLTLNEENIADEHICCGFTDKKIAEGYRLKRELIKSRLSEGFKFKKFNIRGKVFIEYVPAENAWSPIDAPGYMFIHCFWVSGRYKGHGFGTKLLDECINDAERNDKNGIVVVTSRKAMPFLTDKGFFIKKGFEGCDTAPRYFELLVKKLKEAPLPKFRDEAKKAAVENKNGLTFIYSDLCPFTDYWVDKMIEFANDLGIPSEKIKITTKEETQNMPSASALFSVFYNGEFLTHKIVAHKEFSKLLTKHR